MKNFIEVVYKLMFVVGILCIGVGIMAVFLGGSYIDEYKELERSGEQAQVEILEKGTSRSAGNAKSSTDYFQIKYLGEQGKKQFSIIQATSEEFNSYDVGSIVTVVYDPKEPRMAEIIKTPEQLKRLKLKPYKIILFGVMLIAISKILGKVYARL